MKSRFAIALGTGLVLSAAFVETHPEFVRNPPISVRQTCDQLLDQSLCHAATSVRTLAQHRPIGQAGAPVPPDRSATPGAINPAVRQANVGTTICNAAWLAAHEPSASWANAARRRLAAHSSQRLNPETFNLDLLVPVSLDGTSGDDRNLWLLPWENGADAKDRIERALHREVCAGRLPLASAQAMIARDWVDAGSLIGASVGKARLADRGNRNSFAQQQGWIERKAYGPVAVTAECSVPESGEGEGTYAVPAIPQDLNEY